MASIKYTVDVDTKGARTSIAQLENSLGGLGGAVAGAFAVTEVIAFGDSIIGLQNKMRSLTSDQALVSSMFKDITTVAGAARAPLQETGDLYFRIARAAKDLGITQQETSDITQSLAKSMSMTGMTAQESAGALLQLGQALQSGRFQGDELRSVLENMPIVSKAMADELGVTIGELRKLGSEGKITSDIFVRAMQKNKKSIDDAFARSVPTAIQALNNLKTASAVAFTELGTEPGPAKIFVDAAAAILSLTNDVQKLSVVIKELVQVLTILALTFASIKAAAFLGPILATASTGIGKLAGSIGSLLMNGKLLSSMFGSLKGGAGGLGASLASAFNVNAIKGDMTTIINLGKNIGMLIPSMFKTGNIFTGLKTIVGGTIGIFGKLAGLLPLVLGGFLKMIPIAGWIWTIWEAVDALLKLFGGKGLVYYLSLAGNSVDNFFQKFLGVRVIDWVQSKISDLMSQLRSFAEFLGVVDRKAMPGRNRGSKPGSADRTAAEQITTNARKPKDTPFSTTGIPRLAPPDGKAASDTAKETARAQAQALREVKSAILDVTRAYKESSATRLEELQFQYQSLTMSEDQIVLENQRRDILKERKNALDELAQKETEIRESEDLSKKGREEALALIAQQKAAILSASTAELAASDAEIKKIQEKNIEIERSTKLTELNKRANENKAVLQALEDQLTLVGLYGDALEETTAQLELQQKLREIDVEYQNQLLDLEQQRMKLGEQRYANELAHIQAVKAQAIESANAQAAAQKKVSDAQRQVERNDSKNAIGKRLEELKRSVDPAVTAVQMLDSVFSNMGNAIDTFVDTGKFKFADFARSIIADIAKIALKAAATKIFTSIFGSMFGVPGLAAGGPTMANRPYLVGEQGPELFVPNSAGSIMTNASLNKNAGLGQSVQPVVNNTYVTNNISAIDSRSVAQMFVENRKSLFGASQMARKEMPYGS